MLSFLNFYISYLCAIHFHVYNIYFFTDLSKTLARSIGKDQMFWQSTAAFISEYNDTYKQGCINRDSHMRPRGIQEVYK